MLNSRSASALIHPHGLPCPSAINSFLQTRFQLRLDIGHSSARESQAILYSWNGESNPVEFQYEIKDGVLTIYKFPILVDGKEKFLGIEKYPIDILNDSLLAIRSKMGSKYDSKSFSKE